MPNKINIGSDHLQLVHYIWIGALDDQKPTFFFDASQAKRTCFLAGPLSCLRFCKNAEIIIWVEQSNFLQVQHLFKEFLSIKINVLENLLNQNEENLNYIPANLIPFLFRYLKEGPDAKGAAFMKDIFSAVIIAEFGGYFLDTTTMFINPVFLPSITTPKTFLRDASFHKLLEQWDSLDYYERFSLLHVDVWAFAAPKGHAVLTSVLEEYLEKCEQNDNFLTRLHISQVEVNRIPLISGIISRSFARYVIESRSLCESTIWPIILPEEEYNSEVSVLGLKKFHSNSHGSFGSRAYPTVCGILKKYLDEIELSFQKNKEDFLSYPVYQKLICQIKTYITELRANPENSIDDVHIAEKISAIIYSKTENDRDIIKSIQEMLQEKSVLNSLTHDIYQMINNVQLKFDDWNEHSPWVLSRKS